MKSVKFEYYEKSKISKSKIWLHKAFKDLEPMLSDQAIEVGFTRSRTHLSQAAAIAINVPREILKSLTTLK